ncbi:hypothetical protein SLS62_009491 [Diatrype stigma]|uniref:Uncharacterized protein n=1 Tax=Diatrype stigma TaxID=117547 RepID=A0AAN9UG32_9PEZI
MLMNATPPSAAPTMAPVGKALPAAGVSVESDRKIAALSGLSLSLAGKRSAVAQPAALHGLDLQHPRNGVGLEVSALQVYHIFSFWGEKQLCWPILLYASEEKLDDRKESVGHSPPLAAVHGSTVQQPIKRISEFSQMYYSILELTTALLNIIAIIQAV